MTHVEDERRQVMEMLVHELMPGLTSYRSPSDEAMEAVGVWYSRYLEYMKAHHEAAVPMSLAQFLLTKVVVSGFDAFTWAKGTLVKVKDSNMIGIVTGWSDIGFSHPKAAVEVRTAKGESGQYPANLEVAEIPPEVLEYVASTLKGKVHDKVEEAFDADQGP